MDIFFPDPNDPPRPPEEVRLRSLRAEPWPEGGRIKVYLELTPFQKRPSAEVRLIDPVDTVAAQVSIVETFSHKLEFNLHLLPDSPAGKYTLDVTVYYQELPTQEGPEARLPEPLITDHDQYTFLIPG